jgi:branched-chain amino acid transport system permease protein
MTTTTSVPPKGAATPKKNGSNWTTGKAWPIGFSVAAVLVFVLYQFILPVAPESVSTFVVSWFPMSTVNQCVIWATMAVGLNIVVGYAGLLDLGYVAFWAIGGYVAGWLMSGFFTQWRADGVVGWTLGAVVFGRRHQLTIPHWLPVFGTAAPGQDGGIHLSFWLVLPIAGLFCALWGVLIGAPTLRLKSDYLALVTLGFGEIIPEVFKNGDNINGFNLSNGTKGITPIDNISTGPLQYLGVPHELGPFDENWKFVVFVLIAAFCVFVSLRIREGRLGRAWLAIREDELAASMMGVPLMRTKLAAYAVGAFIGGVGGVAYTSAVGSVTAEDFAFSSSIILLAMVVLGGMGNVWGVLLGALVLQWINSNGLTRLGDTIESATGKDVNFSSYNFLVFGLILILMMLFRREGLLPETRTKQVLQEPERGELESVGADLEGENA